eukprot:snap_masked-scaffold_16-processed-gene-3.16-mRNA-1 protein AED:1.00 eAED:1.00 QI:0/-1/0/0/-1/1/1/0/334
MKKIGDIFLKNNEELIEKIKQQSIPGVKKEAPMSGSLRRKVYEFWNTTKDKEKEEHIYFQNYFFRQYGIAARILNNLKKEERSFKPKSLLDVSAKCGQTLFSATKVFSSLEEITVIESSKRNISTMETIFPSELVEKVVVLSKKHIDQLSPKKKFDLVIHSFPGDDAIEVFSKLLPLLSCNGVLVVVNKPQSSVLQEMREIVLKSKELDLRILAPCTHQESCPLAYQNGCSFTQKASNPLSSGLNRSKVQFSYLVISKKDDKKQEKVVRIIEEIQRPKQHVVMKICSDNGIELQTVGKGKLMNRNLGQIYKFAKNAERGGLWFKNLPLEKMHKF